MQIQPLKNSHKILLLICIILIPIVVLSCKPVLRYKKSDSSVNYIPYYIKVYEADSLFLTNNFEKSYKILDSLFKKYEPLQLENVNEYSTYIACSALTGHVNNFEDKIKRGYTKFGGIGFNHAKRDSIRAIINKYNPFTKEEKQHLNELYLTQFDSVLRKKILRMSIEDQEARTFPLDENKMKITDDKHKKIILDIFKKHGYPSYQIIGKMGTFGDKPVQFMVLFMHQDYSFKKRYLNSLYSLMIQGKLSPEEYATIIDRTYLEKDKSMYGMIQQPQVIYPKKLDSIRKTIGLPNVNYQMWAYKKKFPDSNIR